MRELHVGSLDIGNSLLVSRYPGKLRNRQFETICASF